VHRLKCPLKIETEKSRLCAVDASSGKNFELDLTVSDSSMTEPTVRGIRTACGGTKLGGFSRVSKLLIGVASLCAYLVAPALAQAPQSLVLKNDKGAVVYRLETNNNGGRLIAGADKEVFRFNRKDESKRRILNINKGSSSLGFIASKHSGKWEIYDQKNALQFIFKQEEAGYKLKSNDEQSLFRIKPRPYGMEVESSDDKSLYKTRVDTSGIRFENNQSKLVYSAPATANSLMISCFGLEKLSLDQRAALSCAVDTMR
jgi:hypothetical protein